MSNKILSILGLPVSYQGIPTLRFIIISLILLVLLASGCGSCGGCALCGGKVETVVKREAGEAIIDVENLVRLAPASGSQVISVGYSGRVISEGEGSGDGSFSVNMGYDVSKSGVNPAPTIERKNLRPGVWEMRVQAGTWNASCQGNVVKGLGTQFTFHTTEPGCTVQ